MKTSVATTGAQPVQLHQIEEEMSDLSAQIDCLGQAGTDFAIRIHRSTTRLIAAVDELRSGASGPSPHLPYDFWNRTAAAITTLTAVRSAAQAVLRDGP